MIEHHLRVPKWNSGIEMEKYLTNTRVVYERNLVKLKVKVKTVLGRKLNSPVVSLAPAGED